MELPYTPRENIAARIELAKTQIMSLKQQIAGLTKARVDDIDWETYGRPSDVTFSFQIRRSLRGHSKKVSSLDWGGDNITIASLGQDGKLIIHDAYTEMKKDVLNMKSAWMMSVAIERENNTLVAVGGLDNTCSIYSIQEPNSTHYSANATMPLLELTGHQRYLSSCKFISPERILTGSGDASISIWDSVSGVRLTSLTGHNADVTQVCVHPFNPSIIASASCDSSIMIWDTRQKPEEACVLDFIGHFASDVNAVDFFPSGDAIGGGSDDSSCRIFDLRARAGVCVFAEESLPSGVTSVSFSASGRLFFASYETPIVVGWEVVSKEGTYHELRGHKDRISVVKLNPGGQSLATGSWDSSIAVWA